MRESGIVGYLSPIHEQGDIWLYRILIKFKYHMQYITFIEGRKLRVFRKSCLGSVYVWEFHFSIKILALIEHEAILLCLYIIEANLTKELYSHFTVLISH